MTALEYLIAVHGYGAGRFWSVENPKKPASNSELRRWLSQSSLHVNGVAVRPESPMPEHLDSVVLFPKNPRRRVTLL